MNVIEKMTQAVAQYTGQRLPPQGDIFTCEGIAQAAYTAMMQHLAETGQVIVPVEPTARMVVAGANERENGDMELHARKWRAMIAAAKDQA